MRTRFALCGLAVCIAWSACCESGIRSVDLSLRPAGAVYPSYVWLGDTLTVTAIAGTDPRELCYHPLYSAVEQPARFAFRSTDTLVASITDRGLLRARSLGSTLLSASSAGVSSMLPVVVAPAVAALRLDGATLTVNVGDTVAVRVEALDNVGNHVQGGQVWFNLARPVDSVVAFVSPPRAQLPYYTTVATPLTLRLRALRSGDATLVVEAPHEAPGSQPWPTASIVVHVVTKIGFSGGGSGDAPRDR